MFYLLYHSNNVLGVFDSLRCVESTISSLVHNKLTKVNNFNVIGRSLETKYSDEEGTVEAIVAIVN